MTLYEMQKFQALPMSYIAGLPLFEALPNRSTTGKCFIQHISLLDLADTNSLSLSVDQVCRMENFHSHNLHLTWS